MKYFAMLKDSVREALDSTVLYVMFGLSTLMIIAVGALSFKPMPAQKTMEIFFWKEIQSEKGPQLFPPVYSMANRGKKKQSPEDVKALFGQLMQMTYRLVKVESARDVDDDPLGEYVLTVSTILPANPMLPMQFGNDVVADTLHLKNLFHAAEEDGVITIGKIESVPIEDKEKETARFRVTVAGTPKTFRIWVTEMQWAVFPLPFTGPLAIQLFLLTYIVIGTGATVTIVVGIIITSFFFPNMMRKGTIDLLLTKPVHRWVIVLYKYVGGLTFMFLSTAYAMVGIWLAIGLRAGIWAPGILLLIFTLTFFFAIFYAISALAGIVTRSTVVSIMLTLFAYAVLGTFGFGSDFVELKVREEEMREANKKALNAQRKILGKEAHALLQNNPDDENETRWADSASVKLFRAQKAISPRTEDLNKLNELILRADLTTGDLSTMAALDTSDRNWWLSGLVSCAWIATFLGAAMVWFSYKDY